MAFGLMTMSPVDPLSANVGQAALGSMSQEQKEKLETYWGVNEPPAERYLAWAWDFIRGDFGVSLQYRQPVKDVIAVKLGNSLFLMLMAITIVSALFVFGGNLIANILYGIVDPRIRRGGTWK